MAGGGHTNDLRLLDSATHELSRVYNVQSWECPFPLPPQPPALNKIIAVLVRRLHQSQLDRWMYVCLYICTVGWLQARRWGSLVQRNLKEMMVE